MHCFCIHLNFLSSPPRFHSPIACICFLILLLPQFLPKNPASCLLHNGFPITVSRDLQPGSRRQECPCRAQPLLPSATRPARPGKLLLRDSLSGRGGPPPPAGLRARRPVATWLASPEGRECPLRPARPARTAAPGQSPPPSSRSGDVFRCPGRALRTYGRAPPRVRAPGAGPRAPGAAEGG